MWTPAKSVRLSSICTKVAIVLVVVFAAAIPFLVGSYMDYSGKDPGLAGPLSFTLYACALPGLASLFCLDRLLSNINRGDVFIDKNVALLRTISWCSFAVSAILLVSGAYYILFLMVAIAAAFLGLILRVVKNVIEQAIIIKKENDYTI